MYAPGTILVTDSLDSLLKIGQPIAVLAAFPPNEWRDPICQAYDFIASQGTGAYAIRHVLPDGSWRHNATHYR